MKKALCAGLVALAMGGLFGLPASPASAHEQGAKTSVDMARIKSGLHLRPEQEAYWPAVEAAVRDVARDQGTGRHGHVVRIVLDSSAIQRIASAARPLVTALDMQQMQAASGLADRMGLGPVVAALH